METKFKSIEDKKAYIQELERELQQYENPEEIAEELWENRYKDLEISELDERDYRDLDLNLPSRLPILDEIKSPSIRFQVEDFADKLALARALIEHDKEDLAVNLYNRESGFRAVQETLRDRATERWDELKNKDLLPSLKAEKNKLANKIAEEISESVNDLQKGDSRKAERFRNYWDTFLLWRSTTNSITGDSLKPSSGQDIWQLVKDIKQDNITERQGIRNSILVADQKPRSWKNRAGVRIKPWVSGGLYQRAEKFVYSWRKINEKNIKAEIRGYL